MSREIFVVVCGECGEIACAYDPVRSRRDMIGQAVSDASKRGDDIEFRDSPITIGKCNCRAEEPPKEASES